MLIPEWASIEVNLEGTLLELQAEEGAAIYIDFLVTPETHKIWTTRTPDGVVASHVGIQAEEPFFATAPMGAGRLRLSRTGGYSVFIPDNLHSEVLDALTVVGPEGASFAFTEEPMIGATGGGVMSLTSSDRELEGNWGGPVGMVRLSRPVQYLPSEQYKPFRVTLISENDEGVMEAGIVLQFAAGPTPILNLPITSVLLSGGGSSNLTIGDDNEVIGSDDKLRFFFEPLEPGHLRLTDSSVSLTGEPSLLTVNGHDARRRWIEMWPWWVQAIYTALIGIVATTVFAPFFRTFTEKTGK